MPNVVSRQTFPEKGESKGGGGSWSRVKKNLIREDRRNRPQIWLACGNKKKETRSNAGREELSVQISRSPWSGKNFDLARSETKFSGTQGSQGEEKKVVDRRKRGVRQGLQRLGNRRSDRRNNLRGRPLLKQSVRDKKSGKSPKRGKKKTTLLSQRRSYRKNSLLAGVHACAFSANSRQTD